MGEKTNAHEVQVGESKGKRPPLLEDNIKTNIKKIGWGSMDRIHLAQDKDKRRDLVNTAMNLRVP
jgi:hypothetical protein